MLLLHVRIVCVLPCTKLLGSAYALSEAVVGSLSLAFTLAFDREFAQSDLTQAWRR